MSIAERLTSLTLETLLLEVEDSILRVVVNRPDVLNALSPQVIADLRRVFGDLHESLGRDIDGEPDWSVRGVMITGAGARSFVAGADIAAMSAMSPESLRDYAAGAQEMTMWIETLAVPVVAAVNGFALGGGCELALSCDYIFASENASFGQPEVALGLIPGFGGTVRLAQFASVDVARELIFTGRRIDANEALRLGLISRVLPDTGALNEAVRESLMLAAAQSPTAVAAAKRTIRNAQERPTDEGLAIELEAFAARGGTPDAIEGMSAFVEKRQAQFPGR